MDAAKKKNAEGSSRDMAPLTSVLGKRARTKGETMVTGSTGAGNTEICYRCKAPEVASAVDLEVVKGHVEW